MHIRAKNTIYVNNLNEKVKIDGLKKALQAVFGQFGEILHIFASKGLKKRGQAFIAFKEERYAAAAVNAMQGFPFYDKPLKIGFAKCDSDCITKLLGTYIKREKKNSSYKNYEKKVQEASHQLANQPSPVSKTPIISSYVLADKSLSNSSGAGIQNLYSIALPPVPSISVEPPCNNILFLENLPRDANQMLLSTLFGRFPGFKEIRAVAGRPEIAFVEFMNEGYAESAKNSLQGFKLAPNCAINISFAKK